MFFLWFPKSMGWRFVLASGLNIFRPGDQTTFKNQGFGGDLVQDFIFFHRCQKINMEWFLDPGVLNARLQSRAKKKCPPSPASGGNPPEPPHLAFQLLSSLPRPSCPRSCINAANTENRRNLFSSRRPHTPRPTMRSRNNYNDHPQLHFKNLSILFIWHR